MLTELGKSPVEVQRCSLRAGAGEEDWQEAWQRGLAKRLGEKLGEEDEEDRRGGEGEGEEGEVVVLIKSSNPQVGKKHRLLETARQANAIFCLFAAEGGADDKQICFLLC